MTHPALYQTVNRRCPVAKYLDFLIPISFRVYRTHTCRTVLLHCSESADMDRYKSDFLRSQHSAIWIKSCVYEIKYGGGVCVCVCLWVICRRPVGCTNLLSHVGLYPATTRVFTKDCPPDLNANKRHGRSTLLYVRIDRCCDYIIGRGT